MKQINKFSQKDIEATAPLEKIALYATINPEGLPHITFVNSLMAVSPTELAFGQFVRGQSKWFMQQNPKTGFFILSPQVKQMWFGKALWKNKKDEGPELEKYKAMPMQRYNSYFPINRVHYLDLIETTGALHLPVFSIVKSIFCARLSNLKTPAGGHRRILNQYSESLFNKLASLKFIAFKGVDGFPKLIPVFGVLAADSARILFHLGPFRKELEELTDGMEAAVFTLSMKLESVLARGTFSGYRDVFGVRTGMLDINWVYNSMPPNAGQIYPEVKLEPVVEF